MFQKENHIFARRDARLYASDAVFDGIQPAIKG